MLGDCASNPIAYVFSSWPWAIPPVVYASMTEVLEVGVIISSFVVVHLNMMDDIFLIYANIEGIVSFSLFPSFPSFSVLTISQEKNETYSRYTVIVLNM